MRTRRELLKAGLAALAGAVGLPLGKLLPKPKPTIATPVEPYTIVLTTSGFEDKTYTIDWLSAKQS